MKLIKKLILFKVNYINYIQDLKLDKNIIKIILNLIYIIYNKLSKIIYQYNYLKLLNNYKNQNNQFIKYNKN